MYWGRISVSLLPVLLVVLLLIALSNFSMRTLANDEEYEELFEEDAGEVAEVLGQVAFYLGALLNASFVFVRWSRAVINWPSDIMRIIMELHMYGNLVLGLTAIVHGYFLIEYAGLVEYGLGALVIALLVSGLFMRFARDRYVRLAARMMHSQRILTVLLVALLLLHVGLAED